MKGKIILIFASAKSKGVRLPLSILTLADPLIKAGYEVKLFDLRVVGYSQKDFRVFS